MKSTLISVPALVIGLASASAGAQSPPAQAPGGPTPPQAVEHDPSAAQPGYSYNPEGRRDPFLSLLGRGNDTGSSTTRPHGISGLLIGEATVKGTLRDRSGFLALIQSPDNKTYLVRPGDRLMDGSVKAIGQDKVIFSQDVNDPLSLVKQREVPKTVRPIDGRGERPVS